MAPGSPPVKDRVKVGVSPLSWVNEVIQEFGANTTTETILTEAKAAGFEGVETSRAFPSEAASLKSLLDANGLSLASGWHSGFLTERDVEAELSDVRSHAELLANCGAEVMVYGPVGHMVENALDVGLSQRLRLMPDDFDRYGERLTKFAEALKVRWGLTLAYHHHLMMVAEQYAEIEAVMNASGEAVGLLLDTGHAAAAGFDYRLLIENFGSRITHIHLKDVRADVMSDVRANDLTFNEGVRRGMFTIPGDGSIDFSGVAAFIRGGYCGWMIVEAEQDPNKALPAPTVERAGRFVREYII
jgi:inosose dehydratase